MVATRELGELQGRDPRWTENEFQQEFTFRAAVVISKSAMPKIMATIASYFKRSLEANKVGVYQWPPGRIEVTPHADFKGFEALIGTRARNPAVTVLHAANFNGARH